MARPVVRGDGLPSPTPLGCGAIGYEAGSDRPSTHRLRLRSRSAPTGWTRVHAGDEPSVHGTAASPMPFKVVTWLILPVVICLSQRLSHACLSISNCTAKLRMAH